MTEGPLQAAVYRFGLNILALSIIISVFTATLVWLTLTYVLIRPVLRLTRNMVRFRVNPEDASRIIRPSGRSDEIGQAQIELAAMQSELATMLRQKSRLAALGLAVSKINHDLRNMLSSAQIISDRLSASTDPMVQRFVPKLIASLDRAIGFCTETLRYGRAEEERPDRRRFPLALLMEEVGESFGLPGHGRIRWIMEAEPELHIDADRAQLYRVLTNLVRNAIQVLESAAAGAAAGNPHPRRSAAATWCRSPSGITAPACRPARAPTCSRRSRAPAAPAASDWGLRSQPS